MIIAFLGMSVHLGEVDFVKKIRVQFIQPNAEVSSALRYNLII